MATTQARQPNGIPVGGQFAPDTRSEGTMTRRPSGDMIPDLIEVTPETRQVLDALRAAGGRPLSVGGAVRDWLLSRTHGGTADFETAFARRDFTLKLHGQGRSHW
jgi:hypothetical protein